MKRQIARPGIRRDYCGCTFVLGQNRIGDIPIPGGDAGLWWCFGAIVVAAMVGLWPKLKR